MKNLSESYNVVIIGSGNIGSRHLQGIAKIKIPINLYVVDNNLSSINLAKKRFNLAKKNINIRSINFINSIERILIRIDLAIIATNANVRKVIIERLIEKNIVKNLLIEKVCFQSIKDYQSISRKLEKKNINSWVNLAKRLFPLYKEINRKLKNENFFTINVSSGNFDIGCNTIHLLDILTFLSGSKIKKIDMSLIDKKILKSKRKGFIDFKGTLKAKTYRGDELVITNYYDNFSPEILQIASKNYYFHIDHYNNKVKSYKRINNKIVLQKKYQMKELNQSEMTNVMSQNILLNNKCELPDLLESYNIHKPMLAAFLEHINNFSGKKPVNICKIT
jgi:hypothetical protein